MSEGTKGEGGQMKCLRYYTNEGIVCIMYI